MTICNRHGRGWRKEGARAERGQGGREMSDGEMYMSTYETRGLLQDVRPQYSKHGLSMSLLVSGCSTLTNISVVLCSVVNTSPVQRGQHQSCYVPVSSRTSKFCAGRYRRFEGVYHPAGARINTYF